MKNKLHQLAILQVQEANFWEICNKIGSDTLWEKYKKFQEEVDQFEKDNMPELMYHINLIGSDSSEISHYDIDDALTEKFGDSVRADSESGMFSVYIRKERAEEVKEFLKENFKSLSFKEYTDNPISYFTNWTHARRYVKEHNLAVPEVPLDKEKLKVFQDLSNKKKELQEEIKKVEEEITNIF